MSEYDVKTMSDNLIEIGLDTLYEKRQDIRDAIVENLGDEDELTYLKEALIEIEQEIREYRDEQARRD